MSQLNSMVTKLVTNEKTPLVLTVVACTGVIATGLMAVKAAPKAQRLVEEKKAELLKDRLSPLEYAKCTWKYYAPVVGVGTVTIVAIITMNRVTAKNAAILTAGATLATTTLKEYQQHVLEEIGSERESKVRDRIAKRHIAESDQSIADTILIAGSDVLCFDEFSGRYFTSNADRLLKLENEVNRHILSGVGGYIGLNSVYEEMGLEPNEAGYVLGFNLDNLVNFHFSPQLNKDKKPVLAVSFIHHPVEDFANFT